MENEEYTTIVREIAHGLTGDWDHDRVYLNEKSDEYVNHPLGKEILRAIGRLLYERMPENAQREWGRVLRNDTDYHETVIAEVRAHIQGHRIDDARRLIDKIVPPEDLFAEDEVSVYHSLRNSVEVCFFVERFDPVKEVRIPPFPFNEIYELLMYLQVEQGDLDAALGTSEIALRRNPLNTSVLFEAAEIRKMRKELDAFLAETVKCHSFLYQRRDLARYFRNLGYYFIEKEEWDEAVVAYCLSNHWQQSEMAQSQLYYISQKMGRLADPERYGDWNEMIQKRNLPTWPDVLWPQIAWALGNQAYKDGEFDGARFCFSLVVELTGDEEAREMLEKCGELFEG